MRVGPKLMKSALQHHQTMQDAHTAAAEAAEEGPGREFHKIAAQSHAQCAEAITACQKAVQDELEKSADQIRPSGISRVVPTNVKAVPRYGQREIAAPPVDAMFSKLVEIEDGLD
jgi:hypothetical protein